MKQKACTVSGETFLITDEDLVFYEKMGLQEPVICPNERQRRRMAWRNERFLHKRNCSATNQPTLSIYPPDYPGPVYTPEAYWGDSWDGRALGREFDFSKPFFPQFKALFEKVPQISRQVTIVENCDYVNDVLRLKSCYLVFDGEQARDCLYGETFIHLNDCLDFLFLTHSELCYECTNCDNAYNLFYSYNCKNCQHGWFLKDCIGCKDCFGCMGLRNKQYWIYNKPSSKESYERFLKEFNSGSHAHIQNIKKKIRDFWTQGVVKNFCGQQIEDCTGDHLQQCKNCQECFDCSQLRDCKFCSNVLLSAQDCYDLHVWGDDVRLCYNSVAIGSGCQDIIASFWVAMGAESIYHSTFCLNNCKNLLGCASLKKAENCILNKQYTKHEYEVLRDKIIEHMKETGEWGEFFPIEMSPFGYNQTVAQEYFPLQEAEAKKRGYSWQKENPSPVLAPPNIPDHIKDAPDTILSTVFVCESSQKPYKITPFELDFYRKNKLPLPRLHPNERHIERMKLRNPRILHTRNCPHCQKVIQTTYPPDGKEMVLCEDCYLKKVA